jgi:hypothetical protein
MKYTVTWTSGAEKQLASTWLRDMDRSSISAAADTIDRELAHNPLTVGESRSQHTRIHIVAPLAVLYDVYPEDLKVLVWAVWRRSKQR